jgi:hypothetical protein
MSTDLQRGIDLVLHLSQEFGLQCIPSGSRRTNSRMNFDFSNGHKELRVPMSHEFVEDLPGTKEFQIALRGYVSAIALRFREQTFDEYMTLSGVPIRFEIHFPFKRNAAGKSVYSVWATVRIGWDRVFERSFSVSVTDTVAINLPSLESVLTHSLVVNSVRKCIDTIKPVFYPDGEGSSAQEILLGSSEFDWKEKRFVFQRCSDDEIEAFLIRKAYWLGFRRGNLASWVVVPDRFDGQYLGVDENKLKQVAAIAAADRYVHLDSSGLYAQATTTLLASRKRFEDEFLNYLAASPHTAERRVALPYDVFICHASEDKPYVDPLVEALQTAGITVWFDKTSLQWGDDLRSAIDLGISNCRYGIVVFSKAFLSKKKWTEHELSALFAREQAGHKVILPIWQGITRDDLLEYSPAFADRLAKISSSDGYESIVLSLLKMLGRG